MLRRIRRLARTNSWMDDACKHFIVAQYQGIVLAIGSAPEPEQTESIWIVICTFQLEFYLLSGFGGVNGCQHKRWLALMLWRNAGSVMCHKGLGKKRNKTARKIMSVLLRRWKLTLQQSCSREAKKKLTVQDINWQWWCVNNGEISQKADKSNENVLDPIHNKRTLSSKLQAIKSKHPELTAKTIS